MAAGGLPPRAVAERSDGGPMLTGALVTSSAGKLRLVVDYCHANAHMEPRRFKNETIPELVPGLRQDDELISWDVADAYHNLRIRPSDQTYLCFTHQGWVIAPVCMPIGLTRAHFTWTKVCRPLVVRLMELEFVITTYVDGFGGRSLMKRADVPAIKADAAAGCRQAARVLASMGLKVHECKGERIGTDKLPLLGNVVNTQLSVFRLQPWWAAKIEPMAAALLGHGAKHRRCVRLGILRSFCGGAFSSTLSVPQATYRTQSLVALLGPVMRTGTGGGPLRREVPLSHQATAYVRWWSGLTGSAMLRRSLWPRAEEAMVHTDASLTGWRATWNPAVPERVFHPAACMQVHMNVKELGAVRLALQSFVNLLRPAGSVIRLMMDSVVSVDVVNYGTSRWVLRGGRV